MIWDFLVDGANALRLRFKPLTQYHYHWTTMLGVVTLLGMGKFLVFYVVFGFKLPLLILCILVEIVRISALTAAIRQVMLPNIQPQKLLPYILLTEALSLILLVFLTSPDNAIFQILSLIFTLWIYIVQALGLIWFAKTSVLKLVIGYIVYFFMAILTVGILVLLFYALGAFSLEDTQKLMEFIQKQK